MEENISGSLLALLYFVLACNMISYLLGPSPFNIPIVFIFLFGCIIGTFDYKKYHNIKLILLIGLVLLIIMWILVYPQIHQGNTLLSLLVSTIIYIIYLYIFIKSWNKSPNEKDTSTK
jgi:hypothetical protein